MDSVYLYNKYGSPISYDLWTHLRRLVNWVCDNWQRKDEGIWEVRGGQQNFLYSKLMCWVAVDRGLRLADKRSFPADRDRWLKVRDKIYEEIMNEGWNPKRGAFVQHYGSDSLDAANLMLPLVFFASPTDPRMLKTLDATMQPPDKGGLLSNSLVYRYNVDETADGLKGSRIHHLMYCTITNDVLKEVPGLHVLGILDGILQVNGGIHLQGKSHLAVESDKFKDHWRI